jgi:hypothetical protein
MTDEQMREWIDKASYEQLLKQWRFAPFGDPFFQGDIGDYYSKQLAKKRDEVGDEEHVRISKEIGW